MFATYNYQLETEVFSGAIDPHCVDSKSMELGLRSCEPIIVILDSLLRYARAYRKRFEQPIAGDDYASASFKEMLDGCRELFNLDGALAMERNINTDSKSNGACESLYWEIIKVGGYSDK